MRWWSVVNIKSYTHIRTSPVSSSVRLKPTEINAVAKSVDERKLVGGHGTLRSHDNCLTIVCPHAFPFRPYLGPELFYITLLL